MDRSANAACEISELEDGGFKVLIRNEERLLDSLWVLFEIILILLPFVPWRGSASLNAKRDDPRFCDELVFQSGHMTLRASGQSDQTTHPFSTIRQLEYRDSTHGRPHLHFQLDHVPFSLGYGLSPEQANEFLTLVRRIASDIVAR